MWQTGDRGTGSSSRHDVLAVQPNPSPTASGSEFGVTGVQRCVERLGQGEKGGVIAGELVAEVPDPVRQRGDLVAIDVHVEVVAARLLGRGRGELVAQSGRHRAVGIADLLTAVLAREHHLTLIHYDSGFDALAGVLDFAHAWVAPRGGIP